MARALLRRAVTAWKRRIYIAGAIRHLLGSRIAFGRLSTEAIIARFARPSRSDVGPRSAAVDPKLVAWSIERCARWVPWRSDCLIQAMAAAIWLRRHGYEPQLQLGIAPAAKNSAQSAGEPFRAHAWLLLDGRILLGGPGVAEYSAFPLHRAANSEVLGGGPN